MCIRRSKAAQHLAAALEGHQDLRLSRLACRKRDVPCPPSCARMNQPLSELPGSSPYRSWDRSRIEHGTGAHRAASRPHRGAHLHRTSRENTGTLCGAPQAVSPSRAHPKGASGRGSRPRVASPKGANGVQVSRSSRPLGRQAGRTE
jgi:hypothetical protein